MARVSTYINTLGRTEEAFSFYAKIFDTSMQGIQRFSDFDGMKSVLSENELNGLLHVELPILGGHVLMGTDMLESAGHTINIGNNVTINLEPDSKAEADHLYNSLSVDSVEHSDGMNDMDWGAYWGTCLDKFGVRWMFNFTNQP